MCQTIVTKGEMMTGNNKIITALVEAQKNMTKAVKAATNPHFRSKYADLGSVMDACMGPLNDAGIAVLQPTGEDELGRYVETVLMHSESAESLKCRVPLILQKNDMQGYGSAVTYARRYGLMAMAGIAPEDDDGNAAAKAAPKSAQKRSEENEAAEVKWFAEQLPKMFKADDLNAVLSRAKAAGRSVAKMVADRANALGFDFDPDARKYVEISNAKDDLNGDEIPEFEGQS